MIGFDGSIVVVIGVVVGIGKVVVEVFGWLGVCVYVIDIDVYWGVKVVV